MKCPQCSQTLYLGRCPEHGEVNPQTSPAISTELGQEVATKTQEAGEKKQEVQVDEIRPATDEQAAYIEQYGGLPQSLLLTTGDSQAELWGAIDILVARIRQDGARIAELEAERDQLQPKAAVADNLRHGCAAWKQRAEQAEAQCAVLGSVLRALRSAAIEAGGMCHQDDLTYVETRVLELTASALANLPAAAQALLDERERLRVADDACRAIHRLVQGCDSGAYGVAADVLVELGDWLKVEAQEAPHAT